MRLNFGIGKPKAGDVLDRLAVRQRTVDLVRGGEEHHRRHLGSAGAYGFEHVVRTQNVDVEVFARGSHRRGDSGLRREMEHQVNVTRADH